MRKTFPPQPRCQTLGPETSRPSTTIPLSQLLAAIVSGSQLRHNHLAFCSAPPRPWRRPPLPADPWQPDRDEDQITGVGTKGGEVTDGAWLLLIPSKRKLLKKLISHRCCLICSGSVRRIRNALPPPSHPPVLFSGESTATNARAAR